MNIDELKKLDAEATPGPWAQRSAGVDEINDEPVCYVESDDRPINFVATQGGGCGAAIGIPDGRLIVAMRNALPALLAELEALRDVACEAENLLNGDPTAPDDLRRALVILRAMEAKHG